jgi:hypothetical protein
MFDKYMICEDGFRNFVRDGKVAGFQFGARLPYYRGLGLSMVEDIAIAVDGQPVPREQVELQLQCGTYTLAEMETVYDSVWQMGEIAQVRITYPGGLSRGAHRLELTEQLRVSYMPFPVMGRDAKTLTLQE